MFKYLVLRSLCALVSVGGASGVVLPEKTIAFGTLTNAYVDTAFLDSTKRIGTVNIRNQTDSDVSISVDGGVTDSFIVPAGGVILRNLGSYVAPATTAFQIKYLGAAPTQGNVYIDGSY